MNPGRDLDAIIHTNVIGKPLPESWEEWQSKLSDQSVSNGVKDVVFALAKMGVPLYSTSIEAAWPIVEMIKERGDYKIEISAYPKDSCWTIKAFHRDGASKSCTTSAKTLPHAICLAALKAVEK